MALTAKQKLFCQEYVANGYTNATECYCRAFSNPNRNTAQAEACRLLKKPEIREHIKEIQHDRFEALNISADRVAEELAKAAFGEVNEDSPFRYSDKLKALDLLQKQLGLQQTKVKADVEANTTITYNIDIEE